MRLQVQGESGSGGDQCIQTIKRYAELVEIEGPLQFLRGIY